MSRFEKSPVSRSIPFDPTVEGELVSTDVQTAIDELTQRVAQSASPGFSFGRSGNTPSGTWLLRPGSVPSNKTGIPMAIVNPLIALIAVGNENISTFNVEIYEHEGNEVNLTLLTTVSVVSARTGTFNVAIPATSGRQIAIKISSGSCKNPGVDLQLQGQA